MNTFDAVVLDEATDVAVIDGIMIPVNCAFDEDGELAYCKVWINGVWVPLLESWLDHRYGDVRDAVWKSRDEYAREP